MSVLIDKNTRLLVQGITGRDGAFHTQQMIAYGTKVVGGVTPGKGGENVHGVPVFDSVAEAVEKTKANATVIYVPAAFAADAIHEAADAGIALIVCITEGVPVRDTLGAFHKVLALRGATIPVATPSILRSGATSPMTSMSKTRTVALSPTTQSSRCTRSSARANGLFSSV